MMEDSEKIDNRQCEVCGKIGDDITYDVDPFVYEICGDDTLYWMCEECRRQRIRDI